MTGEAARWHLVAVGSIPASVLKSGPVRFLDLIWVNQNRDWSRLVPKRSVTGPDLRRPVHSSPVPVYRLVLTGLFKDQFISRLTVTVFTSSQNIVCPHAASH